MQDRMIRTFNAAGELVAAGYEWREPMVFSGINGTLKALALVMLCFVGLTSPNGGIGAAIPMAVILLAWFFSLDGWPRRVTFHRDGTIAMKWGVNPQYFWKRKISGHFDRIASIEAHKDQVRMYSKYGNIVFVGDKTDEFTAHKAAVQLTMALGEIREACANPARQARPGSATVHRNLPVIP